MRKFYPVLLLVMVMAVIWGCGEKLTEEQLRAKALDFENKEQWAEAVKMYERLVKAYPQSTRAAETLYRLGITYANNLKDFKKAVETHGRIVKEYPNSNFVKQSTFMMGFLYANDISPKALPFSLGVLVSDNRTLVGSFEGKFEEIIDRGVSIPVSRSKSFLVDNYQQSIPILFQNATKRGNLGKIQLNRISSDTRNSDQGISIKINIDKSGYAVATAKGEGIEGSCQFQIREIEKARAAYQEFLQKWPTHELASSVKWELEHLGQDISQIDLNLGEPSAQAPATTPKK